MFVLIGCGGEVDDMLVVMFGVFVVDYVVLWVLSCSLGDMFEIVL